MTQYTIESPLGKPSDVWSACRSMLPPVVAVKPGIVPESDLIKPALGRKGVCSLYMSTDGRSDRSLRSAATSGRERSRNRGRQVRKRHPLVRLGINRGADTEASS